ncbi:MAG: response regulator [candidate division Zixibacteria bacterium]|jgi:DNA-binding NtrC family response regulator|nr:response regulator [candidate division Zixibacteria bacterium]
MTPSHVPSILIVDDEEIIRDFLSEVLEDYDLTLASDGDEAITHMKDKAYDVVITDLRMPKVPGEEVVKAARELRPDARVIIISGYSSLYTVSQSVNHGAFAFLSKPFSIKELLQTVDLALAG